MLAYRQHLVIQDPQQMVLSNLPVKAGQRVEVLILVEEDTATAETMVATVKHRLPFASREQLFAKQQLATTSSLEHLRAIRDEE